MKKLLLAIGVGVLVTLGILGLRYLVDNRMPNFRESREIYVRPGTTPQEVLDSLAGVVKFRRSLQRMFSEKEVARYITPGHYIVKPEHSSVYVARMLNNGWQEPVTLVLAGTLRLKGDMARKISAQMMVDSAAVHEALCSDSLLAQYGFRSSNVFNLFIPDSYEMYWTDGVEAILARQKKAYDAFWTPERDARAKALGLSRAQVGILASIVKGETNYEPEMPQIAGVYLNRLRKGMPLQADPTVAFCFDYTLNRVLHRHLKVDSPYNTYKYKGLPPGPICVPTKACLDAVLNPDPAGNLYFCADPALNGTHRFAVTFREHQKNALEFQKALSSYGKQPTRP